MSTPHVPLVLIILDGWGYSENHEHNAITAANTPFWDALWKRSPHTLAQASGLAVGLPEGQMGNSEVGHLHMGAGRQVLQDLTRLDLSIAHGEFDQNIVLNKTIDQLIQQDKALHILGLLSPGGVHSHENHIQAIIKLAAKRGLKKIYLHPFLDGRDTPPKSAEKSITAIEDLFSQLGHGCIASLVGRYYAMDRDKRWERTQCTYDLLTQNKSEFQADTALSALMQAYARGETDEFVRPTLINATGKIADGDVVLFMNFRADRARQLTRAFTDANFDGFSRAEKPTLSCFVTLTKYADDINAEIALPPIEITHNVGLCVAEKGFKQLRIAETEKYAHVTFFFNGGEEKSYLGEDRILIPSPKVATYDLTPNMSAPEVTRALLDAMATHSYQLVVCNLANPDMLGHTGNLEATIEAIETIDHCLQQIVSAVEAMEGEVLITADHGNAECMFDPQTNQPHTAHTTSLVPVVLATHRPIVPTTNEGVLYDIAPTVLYLMGIEQPGEMSGKPLFKLK